MSREKQLGCKDRAQRNSKHRSVGKSYEVQIVIWSVWAHPHAGERGGGGEFAAPCSISHRHCPLPHPRGGATLKRGQWEFRRRWRRRGLGVRASDRTGLGDVIMPNRETPACRCGLREKEEAGEERFHHSSYQHFVQPAVVVDGVSYDHSPVSRESLANLRGRLVGSEPHIHRLSARARPIGLEPPRLLEPDVQSEQSSAMTPRTMK